MRRLVSARLSVFEQMFVICPSSYLPFAVTIGVPPRDLAFKQGTAAFLIISSLALSAYIACMISELRRLVTAQCCISAFLSSHSFGLCQCLIGAPHPDAAFSDGVSLLS